MIFNSKKAFKNFLSNYCFSDFFHIRIFLFGGCWKDEKYSGSFDTNFQMGPNDAGLAQSARGISECLNTLEERTNDVT